MVTSGIISRPHPFFPRGLSYRSNNILCPIVEAFRRAEVLQAGVLGRGRSREDSVAGQCGELDRVVADRCGACGVSAHGQRAKERDVPPQMRIVRFGEDVSGASGLASFQWKKSVCTAVKCPACKGFSISCCTKRLQCGTYTERGGFQVAHPRRDLPKCGSVINQSCHADQHLWIAQ